MEHNPVVDDVQAKDSSPFGVKDHMLARNQPCGSISSSPGVVRIEGVPR